MALAGPRRVRRNVGPRPKPAGPPSQLFLAGWQFHVLQATQALWRSRHGRDLKPDDAEYPASETLFWAVISRYPDVDMTGWRRPATVPPADEAGVNALLETYRKGSWSLVSALHAEAAAARVSEGRWQLASRCVSAALAVSDSGRARADPSGGGAGAARLGNCSEVDLGPDGHTGIVRKRKTNHRVRLGGGSRTSR